MLPMTLTSKRLKQTLESRDLSAKGNLLQKQATFVLWDFGVLVFRKDLPPQLQWAKGEILEDCVPGKVDIASMLKYLDKN
jgi:hypothetical protein